MKYSKDQIKEIILTDYLDGRLPDSEKKEIDGYIAGDVELRAFLDEAKKMAVEPFEQMPDIHPPEHVWQNIQEKIEGSKQEKEVPFLSGVWEGFLKGVKTLWERPQLSFRLATVMAVVIFVSWVGISQRRMLPAQYSSEEQIEYLMFLAGGDSLITEESEDGFDTTIESYFL